MPTNANKNYEIIVDKSIYLCYNVFEVKEKKKLNKTKSIKEI